jgi:hypothetical protein
MRGWLTVSIVFVVFYTCPERPAVADNPIQLTALLDALPFRARRRNAPLHGLHTGDKLGPLENPYVLAPVGFAAAMLCTKLFLSPYVCILPVSPMSRQRLTACLGRCMCAWILASRSPLRE